MAVKVYARHGGAAAAATDDITARVPAFAGLGSDSGPMIQMGMSVQNGGASTGTLIVPDPVGNLDASLYFPPHTQITLTEDASGDELMLAQGRLSSFEIGRADVQPPGDDVQWNLTIDDANADLRGLALTEDWVRPAETGVARLYALALYTLNGTSSTRPNYNGKITYRPSTTIVALDAHLAKNTDTVSMPAKTYPANTQPMDIVSDIATTEGKVYGVVPHHVAGVSHLCMLYIKETDHATYASALKISDDPAEWDPDDLTVPVLAPIWDQGNGQQVDGNANISGLVSRYGQNDSVVVLLDETLGDNNEYWVEGYQDGDSADAAQAAARAAAIVAYRAPFSETDSVSIELNPNQTHLVTAGMSIEVKAAPINTGTTSTIGTYVDRRIVSLQWEPRANGKYHAILQLNRPTGHGLSGGSGQPASTTPSPAPPETGGCIETFTRTVVNSWGVSELGPVYLPQLSPNNFDVADGYGTIVGAGSNGARTYMDALLLSYPLEILMRLKVMNDETGLVQFKMSTQSQVGIFDAPDNGAWQGFDFTFGPDGVVDDFRYGYEADDITIPVPTVPSPTFDGLSGFYVRLFSSDTYFRVRAWPEGDAEPTDWNVADLTVTGGVAPAPTFLWWNCLDASDPRGIIGWDWYKFISGLDCGHGDPSVYAAFDDPRFEDDFVSSAKWGAD